MGPAFRRKWLVIGWVLVGLIVGGSLMPGLPSSDVQHVDKIQHVCAYFLLMNWFAQAMRLRRASIAVAVFAMGVAVELLQGMTGWRTYDMYDMAANTTGVLLGWLAAPPRGPDLYARVAAAYASRGMP